MIKIKLKSKLEPNGEHSFFSNKPNANEVGKGNGMGERNFKFVAK